MPAFLRFTVLLSNVSFLSVGMYSSDTAAFKYETIDESIKQPSRLMGDDLSGPIPADLPTPDFLHLGPLRSSKLKQQHIRAERIKRNVNTKNNASKLASTATPTTPNGLQSKMNGSANIETWLKILNISFASSSLGNRSVSTKRLCGAAPNNRTNNTTTTSRPCQGGFLPWKPIPGKETRNPCVKRIVKWYFTSRKEIVTEFECRRDTIYCRQTSGVMGRCQPIKVQHAALGKIITVGCKCKK